MDKGCNYTGKDIGAWYPDSTCVDGYLWDMDSGYGEYDGGWVYTIGGDIPCPKCNPVDLINPHYKENQWIIEDDFIECEYCGSILYDDPISTSLPFCGVCAKTLSK